MQGFSKGLLDLGAGLYSCQVTLDNLEENRQVAGNLDQSVSKVTVVESDVVIDHKFEKSVLTLFLAPAKHEDEAQLPVAVAVVAAAAVVVVVAAEAGGLAPCNAEPIPSLYLQD